jgi:sn-glycerol 3-phosphate transport system permease protein
MTNRRRTRWSVAADVTTIVIALLWLVPLFFSILVSFRPQAEPVTQGNVFFGSTITFANYAAAWEVAPWGWHFFTSVVFVVGVQVVQIFIVTMAGYAFARMKFPGKTLLFYLIMLQLMIPTGVLLVQQLTLIRSLPFPAGMTFENGLFGLIEWRQQGWFDTRWALMAPYWGSAFGMLLLRQTFRGVPYELEEAARIDGANLFQIITSVYMPLSIPAYIAFALVSISSHWNEFLWPFIVTRTPEVRPLTVGLNRLFQTTEVGALYGQLMAGTIIVIFPLVILFLLFQRRFIESFASSGIK